MPKRKNDNTQSTSSPPKILKSNIEIIEQWAKGDGNCIDLTEYLNKKEWELWHKRRNENPINTENLPYLPNNYKN